MTSAYATLANNGVHCAPYAIDAIVDAGGKTVVPTTRSASACSTRRSRRRRTRSSRASSRAAPAARNGQIGRPAGAKTGTTDDYKDAWFAGFTPKFATVVWIGLPEGPDASAVQHPRLPRGVRRQPARDDLDPLHARRPPGFPVPRSRRRRPSKAVVARRHRDLVRRSEIGARGRRLHRSQSRSHRRRARASSRAQGPTAPGIDGRSRTIDHARPCPTAPVGGARPNRSPNRRDRRHRAT